jgi:hypothetical protein
MSFRTARSALSKELAAVVAWLTANVLSGVVVMGLYRTSPRAASKPVIRDLLPSSARWWVAFGPLPVIVGLWTYLAWREDGLLNMRRRLPTTPVLFPGDRDRPRQAQHLPAGAGRHRVAAP